LGQAHIAFLVDVVVKKLVGHGHTGLISDGNSVFIDMIPF
jgi:hypothetical protein